VILDVNMPSGSGLGVCEIMAADEQLRGVPVIVLTGCSDQETIRRCHDMMVFYVQKGADVWNRIEPLVRELLHLGDAPMPVEPVAEMSPADVRSQKVAATPISSDEATVLMDAVFAILGADGSTPAALCEGDDVAPHEIVELPWVLCIDDDFDYSDALKIRFGEYGVAVARASNGMAGFRMAFSTPASAILLDYQMPNGQRDYILDRLKSNPITRDIPVFMITGIRDKTLERRVMAMGAAGFFNKPIQFESLRQRLANYIDALAVRADMVV
jgi:CheY-like chemotaxis protein